MESPKYVSGPLAADTSVRRDSTMPRTISGTATTKPAIGPAAPMSSSTLREARSVRMAITAPSVPSIKTGGTGMKCGSEASTP